MKSNEIPRIHENRRDPGIIVFSDCSCEVVKEIVKRVSVPAALLFLHRNLQYYITAGRQAQIDSHHLIAPTNKQVIGIW